VIQRDSFDCHLLDKAISRGIEVIETKALGLKENRLLTSDFCIEAKVIIGADGPKSNVAKWAGLPTPQKYLHGVQVTTPYRSEREDFVEVFLSKDIVPDFFAWAVPAGEGMARIGLATANRDEAPRLLKKFLRRLGVDLNLKITKGVIPIGPPARTVAGRVMIVGDAAGQAKPTSGGGIYTGIFCAKIAGEVAAKCALGDTNPLEYEIRWRKALGRELGFGMKAHNIFCKLSDNTIDKILSLLCDPAVQKIIVEHGDIDYPSILVKKLAKVPRFWSKLVEIVPSSFIDFLI
jgi:flavin-dependent dehydrogenase